MENSVYRPILKLTRLRYAEGMETINSLPLGSSSPAWRSANAADAKAGAQSLAPTQKARIFIVDDYAVMRENLRKLLEFESDFEVCGEAENVSQAAHGILETRPDLAIVDLVLGTETGVDLLDRLRQAPQPIPVLILTMLPETLNAEFLMKKGARGYLMKTESADEVLVAVRRILQGGTYLSPESQNRLRDSTKGKSR